MVWSEVTLVCELVLGCLLSSINLGFLNGAKSMESKLRICFYISVSLTFSLFWSLTCSSYFVAAEYNRLLDYVFKVNKYNPIARPVQSIKNVTEVEHEFAIQQIINIVSFSNYQISFHKSFLSFSEQHVSLYRNFSRLFNIFSI